MRLFPQPQVLKDFLNHVRLVNELLENTFRSVNIARANEMALMCHKLRIEAWKSQLTRRQD